MASSSHTPKPPSTLLPVASGHSSFSSTSSPPSTVLSSHDHILPHGWCCKVDARTNKYYFVRESGHADLPDIPTSTASSTTSSPSPGYGRHQYQFTSARYRTSEYAVERITKIFPEVDEDHVSYLLRIYHNKEDVVVKTLLGEGCRVEGMVTIDEGLFYKLRNNFPLVNPETIRLILAKHNNVEHEAIMAILYAQSSKGSRFTQPAGPSSPKIKLRYLKILFPNVEENKLFDLLYNNDHDALKVITDLEHMGYKKTDVVGMQRGKRDGKSVADEQSLEKRAVRPTSIRLHFPVAVSEKDKIIKKLKDTFPQVSDALIELALECSEYDDSKAAIFLSAMTPEDSDKYLKKAFAEKIPTTRQLPCIGTQTKAFIETVPDVPITVDIAARTYESHDRMTWTKEDNVILKRTKLPLARGPDSGLRTGPQIHRVERIVAPGPKQKERCYLSERSGPDAGLRRGPNVARLGADSSLRRGADSKLRIVKLPPKSDDDSE